MSYLDRVRSSSDAKIITGGNGDKSKGYFIEPTVILTENPHFFTMEEEIFGPVMTIYLYNDDDFDGALKALRRNFSLCPYRIDLQQ